MRYFFYGTLRDAEVRRRILGQILPSDGEAAVLTGFKCVVAPGETYPTLASAPDEVTGELFDGITRAQRRRLLRFEGYEYRETLLSVTTLAGAISQARVFLPLQPPPGGAPSWSMERWRQCNRKRFLRSLDRSGL